MQNSRGLDPDALYWDEQGQISCGDHAPLKGSDTWVSGGWVRVSAREAVTLNAKCETCRKAAK